jgi:hypothetical protein
MDQIPFGFWRAVAEGFIQSQLNKPFLGRAYLKFGQCFGLWTHLFELGGILGAKHAGHLDAFVSAFLGMSGKAGAAKCFLVESASNVLKQHSLGSMKFWDYVGVDVADRLGYKTIDWSSLIMERGTEKCPPDFARSNGWGFAARGAALGTMHPDIFRGIFERTHAPIPEAEWQQAYAAGLDIGPEQPRTSYAEAEETENRNFMEYCREFHADLYSVLKEAAI